MRVVTALLSEFSQTSHTRATSTQIKKQDTGWSPVLSPPCPPCPSVELWAWPQMVWLCLCLFCVEAELCRVGSLVAAPLAPFCVTVSFVLPCVIRLCESTTAHSPSRLGWGRSVVSRSDLRDWLCCGHSGYSPLGVHEMRCRWTRLNLEWLSVRYTYVCVRSVLVFLPNTCQFTLSPAARGGSGCSLPHQRLVCVVSSAFRPFWKVCS